MVSLPIANLLTEYLRRRGSLESVSSDVCPGDARHAICNAGMPAGRTLYSRHCALRPSSCPARKLSQHFFGRRHQRLVGDRQQAAGSDEFRRKLPQHAVVARPGSTWPGWLPADAVGQGLLAARRWSCPTVSTPSKDCSTGLPSTSPATVKWTTWQAPEAKPSRPPSFEATFSTAAQAAAIRGDDSVFRSFVAKTIIYNPSSKARIGLYQILPVRCGYCNRLTPVARPSTLTVASCQSLFRCAEDAPVQPCRYSKKRPTPGRVRQWALRIPVLFGQALLIPVARRRPSIASDDVLKYTAVAGIFNHVFRANFPQKHQTAFETPCELPSCKDETFANNHILQRYALFDSSTPLPVLPRCLPARTRQARQGS